jgi:large subunit ribosomal protein L35
MPKLKTHKGTAKRITVTGSGKIMAEHAGCRHLLTNKSDRKKVKMVVNSTDCKKIKRLVPGV